MRINWLRPFVSTIVVLFAGVSMAADELPVLNQKGLDALQGRWRFEWYEQNGQRQEALRKDTRPPIVIQGDQWMHSDQKYKVSVDASFDPKIINLDVSSDLGTDQVWEGIYTIEDDKLRICYYVGDDANRPTQFATQPDSNLLVYEFTRIQSE